ncbi:MULTISPECIES: hypothetical protein [unclassified Clostridium]|uniref:hypothetical protein n=1 Tax=unclassified Clostridium TaxID=2614128 RepID=UPI0013FBA80F|nr:MULTISPECIES: hypothetical protein [unclassified Clostridium]NFR87440.1 hypothetical protein [Clostridium botulinum]NFR89392.1 hypothetical protein [Clostridium botulinum]NFT98969.1 hypothetical protein [Clostridium botulinum]
MKKLCFIQVDNRYGEFLFKKINGKEVIKYTIDQICRINDINKIVISTYRCEDNKIFSELPKYNSLIELEYSNDENLSKRFIECAEKYDEEIILRIVGEQCFLNHEKVNEIIKKFECDNLDFYYPVNNNGTLPECVRRNVILSNKNLIQSRDRYYKVFLECLVNCKMIKEEVEHVPNNLYVNNTLSFYIAKSIIENGIDCMDKTLKKINNKLLEKMYDKESYFNKVGYIKSILEEKIADDEGELPWLSYGIIDILKSRINKGMKVFEYGSGNSTIWWSERVEKVISVEHDRKWYEILKNNKKYNFNNLIYASLDNTNEYETAILTTNNLYDIIVIDGRKRVKCSKVCLKSLKDNGVIIWDDSNREYYKEGIDMLKKNGFNELYIRGIGAMGSGLRQTSIFYKKNNCLNI